MPSHPLRLVFDARGPLLEAARACEADIFWQEYGITLPEHMAEFAPYEDSSVFVVLADADDAVHGLVRLLPPGTRAKTLVQFGEDPWGVDADRSAAAAGLDLSSTWDVATMGVRPGARGTRVHHSLMLYHALIQAALANEATAFLAILDERVRRLLNTVGIVMHALPAASPQAFEGSKASTPVYAAMTPMLDRQRRELPDAHRLVTQGVGLDGLTPTRLVDFRLADLRLADLRLAEAPVAADGLTSPRVAAAR